MNKSELKKLAEVKPNVITRILKTNYPDIFKDINEKYDKCNKFSEKLYLYLNDMDYVICKSETCINPCKFTSLTKGYSKYCSNQCAADDLKNVRHSNAKKTMIIKYGVTTPLKSEKFSKKIKKHHQNGTYDYEKINSKRKTTLKAKYGDENYNNQQKLKETKLKIYGDASYNNRDKFLKTLIDKYGEPVHPNVKKTTSNLSKSGKIGFKSKKFKEWLAINDIDNTSQLDTVKSNKLKKKLENSYDTVLNRLNKIVIPNFTKDTFDGVGYYDKLYNFTCTECITNFDDYLYAGHIPKCPKCYPTTQHTSLGQIELYNFIKELLPVSDIIQNDRKILSGKELDIYIPDKNIAIEFNSLYYHSELSGGKDKNYHLNKTNKCNELGIKLIHIRDIDWYYKQNIIKKRLSHILKSTTNKIYARKCEVILLNKSQKNKFLNENHLQSSDKSQIWLGLKYENEIVSVMTFGNLRNIMGSTPKENNYELYRYTTTRHILGGASKLLNFFIKTYTPSKIITYSNLEWGYSFFYEKIGFIYTSQTPPNYWYIKNGKLTHRSNFQKHKLKDKLEKFDKSLTEWENMQINGYDRIWDCGSLKYVMDFQ
jgi:hypothetical protein